jgi:hypothetical protein
VDANALAALPPEDEVEAPAQAEPSRLRASGGLKDAEADEAAARSSSRPASPAALQPPPWTGTKRPRQAEQPLEVVHVDSSDDGGSNGDGDGDGEGAGTAQTVAPEAPPPTSVREAAAVPVSARSLRRPRGAPETAVPVTAPALAAAVLARAAAAADEEPRQAPASAAAAAAAAGAAALVSSQSRRDPFRSTSAVPHARCFKLSPDQELVQMYTYARTRNSYYFPPGVDKYTKVLLQCPGNRAGITHLELQSLQPGAWVRDEPMNFFIRQLNDEHRAAALEAAAAAASPPPPVQLTGAGASHRVARLHMWNTYFAASLMRSSYVYNPRTTRKAGLSAADVAAVDLWLFPLNVRRVHWALAVLDVRSRTLHYYDSLSTPTFDGERQLRAVLQWWADESADKLGKRTDTKAWKIIRHQKGIMFQENSNDCGLFTL